MARCSEIDVQSAAMRYPDIPWDAIAEEINACPIEKLAQLKTQLIDPQETRLGVRMAVINLRHSRAWAIIGESESKCCEINLHNGVDSVWCRALGITCLKRAKELNDAALEPGIEEYE